MYDLIRFLPLLITFGVFPVVALLCLRFLDPGRRAAGLAVAGLLLLPPLCILAADTDADPSPDFAAQRMEALPALVLPWRVLRDFEQTMACLLRAGELTTDQLDERLRELGHDIAPDILSARLRDLARAGKLSATADGAWASCRA